jgi:hypothetical protein
MKVDSAAPCQCHSSGGGVDGLAGVDGDGLAAAGLDERDPVSDAEGLAEGVDVPGCPCPGCEADDAGCHPVRLGPLLSDRINPDVASEPFRWPFAGRLGGFDLHGFST